MPTLMIDNFAGGLNNYSAEKIGVNEAAILERFFCHQGNAQSFDGRTTFNTTTFGGSGIEGFTTYYPTDGSTPLMVVQAGMRVWLMKTNSGEFRPIYDFTGSGLLPTSFVQWGAYLYMALRSNTMKCWDGFSYTTGTVTCTGNTTLTGNSTQWVTGAVAAGDTVYINTTGSTWAGPYYVQSITNATTIVLTGNGPSATAKDYIISRVHTVGVPAPGTGPTLAAVGSGGSLSAGVYKYKVTYANSHTGYESNPTAAATASVTCVANGSVTVTPNADTGVLADLQIDQLKIYRTKAGGSIYYLSSTQSRNQAGYLFETTYTDTTADASLGAVIETTHDTPVTSLRGIRLFNNRIYGFAADNTLRFSTLNKAEYWPTNQYGSVDVLSFDQVLGGYVTVGSGADKIMAVVPEGGAYSNSGQRGTNLLILKDGGLAYRWYGLDWSDFMIEEAFATECVSYKAALNYKGILYWVSRAGPLALPAGSNTPIPLYQKILPTLSTNLRTLVSYDLESLTLGAWNDFLIFSGRYAGDNIQSMFLHIPTGAWNTLNHATQAIYAGIFSNYDSSDSVNGLYYGDVTASNIYKLFAKTSTNTYWTGTTGVSCQYRSPIFTGGARESLQLKEVQEIRAYWQKPSADQTVTVKVITNGGVTADTTDKTISSSGSNTRVMTRHSPATAAEGWGFQVDISGTFTVPVILERIEIDYAPHGAAQV